MRLPLVLWFALIGPGKHVIKSRISAQRTPFVRLCPGNQKSLPNIKRCSDIITSLRPFLLSPLREINISASQRLSENLRGAARDAADEMPLTAAWQCRGGACTLPRCTPIPIKRPSPPFRWGKCKRKRRKADAVVATKLSEWCGKNFLCASSKQQLQCVLAKLCSPNEA